MTHAEWLKYKYECLAKSCHDDQLYCKIRNELQKLYGLVFIQKNAIGEDRLEVTQALVNKKNEIEEILK